MPEGDTIARGATVLHEALAGQLVTGFSSVLAPVASAAEAHPLAGRTVTHVAAHGKHLVIAFSGDLVLRTHMRMHGSWHLYRPGERWRRSSRALRLRLDTAAWVAVAFDVYDAELVAAADARDLPAIRRLGPDLTASDLDVAAAAARVRADPRPLADVLLDQRVLAGIGNVFRSELLFLAGRDPRTPATTLDVADAETLVRSAARLLRLNARVGFGRRVTTGRHAPDARLWVYQRTGQPCRRCGTAIRSDVDAPVMRRVYWCPRCQPVRPASLGR